MGERISIAALREIEVLHRLGARVPLTHIELLALLDAVEAAHADRYWRLCGVVPLDDPCVGVRASERFIDCLARFDFGEPARDE